MATMIPDVISKFAAHSERIIFENLMRSAKARDWTVFHQHYVPNPKGGPDLEIDILILIPEHSAVICLEAKGGSYDIKSGKWYNSEEEFISTPPPDQARNAMFGFEYKYISGRKKLITLDCAVAFTDSSYPAGTTKPTHLLIIERNEARDKDKLANKLDAYARELVSSRVSKNPTLAKRGAKNKARKAFAELTFDLEEEKNVKIQPQLITRKDLETLDDEFVRLTNDQFTMLNVLQRPRNRRVVIDGAAGTGKTVLAMELARSLCENGETVALLCSNPNLSGRFERWAQTLPTDSGGRVIVGTPDSLPLSAVKVLTENEELQLRLEQLKKHFPQLEESLKSGNLDQRWDNFVSQVVHVLKEFEVTFDYLIVDEAQNLCHKAFLDLMDALLKYGLKGGRWSMFGDFEYQEILFPKQGTDGLKTLDRRGLDFLDYPLKTNCRNTYEIAAAIRTYVFVPSLPISGVRGPEVQIKYFESDDALGDLLDGLIENLQDRQFYSRQIILLANDKRDFSTRRDYSGWSLRNIREGRGTAMPHETETALSVSGDSSPKTLRYSDISDFQGLESNVVILVIPTTKEQTVVGGGVTLPEEDHLKKVLYTGMSRAKAMLIIVADVAWETYFKRMPGIDKTYEDRISEIGEAARQRDSN